MSSIDRIAGPPPPGPPQPHPLPPLKPNPDVEEAIKEIEDFLNELPKMSHGHYLSLKEFDRIKGEIQKVLDALSKSPFSKIPSLQKYKAGLQKIVHTMNEWDWAGGIPDKDANSFQSFATEFLSELKKNIYAPP